jgi:hypothetical protein
MMGASEVGAEEATGGEGIESEDGAISGTELRAASERAASCTTQASHT